MVKFSIYYAVFNLEILWIHTYKNVNKIHFFKLKKASALGGPLLKFSIYYAECCFYLRNIMNIYTYKNVFFLKILIKSLILKLKLYVYFLLLLYTVNFKSPNSWFGKLRLVNSRCSTRYSYLRWYSYWAVEFFPTCTLFRVVLLLGTREYYGHPNNRS